MIHEADLEKKSYLKDLIKIAEKYGFLIIIVFFSLIFSKISPKFLTVQNFTNLSIQVVPTAFLSLGLMFVIITGGLDLSSGLSISLSAVTLEAVYRASGNLFISLLVSLLVAFAVGAVNGLMISKINIEPVIVTLIMMNIVQGAAFIVSKTGLTVNLGNDFFRSLIKGRLVGIPVTFLIMIGIYLSSYIILNHTKYGFYLVAVGNNKEGARLAGINVRKLLFFPYMTIGFYVWLTMFFSVARVSYVTPTFGGIPLFMDSLAAVLIGGVAITGGRGSVFGVLTGACGIAIINNAIN